MYLDIWFTDFIESPTNQLQLLRTTCTDSVGRAPQNSCNHKKYVRLGKLIGAVVYFSPTIAKNNYMDCRISMESSH